MTRDLYCEKCSATFNNVGGGDRIFCDQNNDFVDVCKCPLITREEHTMKMLKVKEETKELVPAEVTRFAPKREREQRGGEFLTDDMIQPDPMRLTQMTAPAVERIGMAAATGIDEVAKKFVDDAKANAQQLVDDAHRQADKMVKDAEDIALRMMEFSTDVRTYSMAKSAQVSKFCSVAESVMGSMYALGDHFVANRREEVEQARAAEEPLEPPSFIRRPQK